jgi:hypothetical protein
MLRQDALSVLMAAEASPRLPLSLVLGPSPALLETPERFAVGTAERL